MNQKPLIFIVDDEPMVRKALMNSVESLDARVCAFPTAQLCFEALQEEHCDLVITDMNMPGMSGIELLRQIKSSLPLVGVMVITGFGSVASAVEAMRMGALDFIEKPLDEDTILPKIKLAIAKLHPPETSEELSRAEEIILEMIGQGLANKEIAFRVNRSLRTVENHRHRMMKKLGASGTADLVRIALARASKG